MSPILLINEIQILVYVTAWQLHKRWETLWDTDFISPQTLEDIFWAAWKRRASEILQRPYSRKTQMAFISLLLKVSVLVCFLELSNKPMLFLWRVMHCCRLLYLWQLRVALHSKVTVTFLMQQLPSNVLRQLFSCLMSSNYAHHSPRYTDANCLSLLPFCIINFLAMGMYAVHGTQWSP